MLGQNDMSRIDFYVLGTSGDHSRNHFACRLAEKAYRLSNTVHIQTIDKAAAAQLDELLWTYRDGSFVPHEIASAELTRPASPITIGHGESPREQTDLLINLSGKIPPKNDAVPRIAEIVTADDGSRQQSRVLYAEYRDRGHTLQTHKL